MLENTSNISAFLILKQKSYKQGPLKVFMHNIEVRYGGDTQVRTRGNVFFAYNKYTLQIITSYNGVANQLVKSNLQLMAY